MSLWCHGRGGSRCLLKRNKQRCHKVGSASSAPQSQAQARWAIFVSGGGSLLRAVHTEMLQGRVEGEVVVAVSNKTNSKACDYCRQHGIPIVEFPSSSGELTAAELGERMVNEYKATHMVLAGYVKLVPVEVLDRFRWRAINVHPALLPSFGGKGHYGMAVHRAVLQSGARISGPTVHFVSEQYDEGAIIAQRPVPVYPEDTSEDLAKRVGKEERDLLPTVCNALAEGRVHVWDDGRAVIEATATESLELLGGADSMRRSMTSDATYHFL